MYLVLHTPARPELSAGRIQPMPMPPRPRPASGTGGEGLVGSDAVVCQLPTTQDQELDELQDVVAPPLPPGHGLGRALVPGQGDTGLLAVTGIPCTVVLRRRLRPTCPAASCVAARPWGTTSPAILHLRQTFVLRSQHSSPYSGNLQFFLLFYVASGEQQPCTRFQQCSVIRVVFWQFI